MLSALKDILKPTGMPQLSDSPVLPHALKLPIFKYLKDKRVVLASASPRRKELLETMGLQPEIVPSTFKENLPHAAYSHAYAEYPVATAGEKAMEVYERLVREDGVNPPDLVISADTIIIHPPQRSTQTTSFSNFGSSGLVSADPTSSSSSDPTSASDSIEAHTGINESYATQGQDGSNGSEPSILEKPLDREDQLRMLVEMNGGRCEVVTGVCIVYPTIAQPGFKMQSIAVSTLVTFDDNSEDVLRSYVEHGEGIDRAGGFAIQGLGGILVKSIEGDYTNVVGFPSAPFWKWLGELHEDGAFED